MPSLKLLVLVVEPESKRETNPRYRFKTQNIKDAENLSSSKPLIIILDDEEIIIEVPMREIKRWGRIYCEEINQWIRRKKLHQYEQGNPPKLIFKQDGNNLKLLSIDKKMSRRKSKLHEDVLRLISEGELKEPFTGEDVKKLLKDKWADATYNVFFTKHRVGNPGGYTEYYIKTKAGYKINK